MLMALTLVATMPTAMAQARVDVPLQYLPALAGDYFPLRSQANGQDYHVYVRLPEGYARHPEKSYPVVYLLDGDSLFPLLAPTHLFLHYDEGLPEAILVGIAYGSFDPPVNRRLIDFSSPGGDTPADEGGAPEFLAFLRDQLLPITEQRYRIDPSRRVLLGQSRAGYFVLWSALQAPDLFWGRIASNPAFTRHREALFAAPTAAESTPKLALVSGARDEPFRVSNAVEWSTYWQARADKPWELHRFDLPQGTHAASIGEGYRQAMLWLFRDDIPVPQIPEQVR